MIFLSPLFEVSTTSKVPKFHNSQEMYNYNNNIFIQNLLFMQGHPKYLL